MKAERAVSDCSSSRRDPVHMPEMDSLKIRDEDADKKIAARLAKLAPKLPAKLNDAQEAEIAALVKKGPSHVSRCNREQVTFADLQRLNPRQWANDEIMNYYGTMIQDAADARVALAAEGKLPKDEALSLHYFSTFFFAKLEKPGYEKAKLARWTKKIDIFKKDLVLIPINQGNAHWTSAVINFKHKRIEAYDSMGEGSARSIFEQLKGYLQSESMDKKKVPFDFTGWEMYTDYKVSPCSEVTTCALKITDRLFELFLHSVDDASTIERVRLRHLQLSSARVGLERPGVRQLGVRTRE
jgi:sentrin-specific protease 1